MKKNATLAEDVDFARLPPCDWKLRRIEIIIIETPRPNDPHIIGFLRPYLSRKNVGNRLPMKNIRLIMPPSKRDRFRERPTLNCSTEVM